MCLRCGGLSCANFLKQTFLDLVPVWQNARERWLKPSQLQVPGHAMWSSAVLGLMADMCTVAASGEYSGPTRAAMLCTFGGSATAQKPKRTTSAPVTREAAFILRACKRLQIFVIAERRDSSTYRSGARTTSLT